MSPAGRSYKQLDTRRTPATQAGNAASGRSKEPQGMSSAVQLVAMLALLIYSAFYLFFVAWASEHTTGNPLVRKLRLTAFLGGAFLPILVILILLLP
jgi:hypothetical protein